MKKVITNGVFDILHAGHVHLLEFARSQGDYLIVAIDSDENVRRLKGEHRPINCQFLRRRVLESIRYVDEVVIFENQHDLLGLYTSCSPDILVKGSEYSIEGLRGTGVPSNVEIRLCPLIDGLSTTRTITKIRELASGTKYAQPTLH